MNKSQIVFDNVCFNYDKGQPVIENITLNINKGESVGLVGANGAGKSTLLKLLVGLVENYSGNIFVNDLKVERKNYQKLRADIGYVFQDSDSQLFMPTVYDEIAFAPKNYGLDKEAIRKRTEAALESVNIMHLKDKSIFKLSGGEKKIVSIATILSMEPNIILMDEPSIALDPKNRRNLINILNNFNQLKIIASHDLDMIWDTCERTIVISEGKIAADGSTKEILSNEKLMLNNGLELPLRLQK